MSPDRLWTQEEVAERLNVSVHAVRKWRREGRIAFIKINNTVRFEKAEVDAFIARNRREKPCDGCAIAVG